MATVPDNFECLPITGMNVLKDLGISANRFDIITLDQYLTNFEIFKYLYIGVGGDVQVEKIDGTVGIFTAVPGGTILPCIGRRVLSGGTTAAAITWMGGISSRKMPN